MTTNLRPTHPTDPGTDEAWAAHLRDLSTDVAAPTVADPHTMSRVAIRRTRTRRAVLTTGGGMLTVAVVAGAAFALGGPTTQGDLAPGASSPASRPAVEAASGAASAAPNGWHVHELEGLTYALPPEIVTSGPSQDEPGVTSDMWHDGEDPDAPPFLRMAYYDEGSSSSAWPDVADKPGAEFDLPGAESATVSDVAAEVAGLPSGTDVCDDCKGPAMVVIERADGPGAYVISLNIPAEGSKEFVERFRATLGLS